jgi:hypothetical protein
MGGRLRLSCKSDKPIALDTRAHALRFFAKALGLQS